MIIDTHTHFGDPEQPQALLYRTALPATYKALAIPAGITGTVVVETARHIEDNQWVLDQAGSDPFIVGLVGNLDPFADDFAPTLERFAANPLFKGFRLHTSCCRPYAGNPLQPAGEIAPRLRASLELLVARDLTLDFHGDHTTLGYAAELTRQVPGLRLVLNHIAECRPIDGQAPNPEWTRSLREIAAQTEAYCKISALVQMTETIPAPAAVEFYRPTLDVVWNAFGAERVIYASNWPQIERVGDFATAHRIVARYFESKGSAAEEKFFWQNSQNAYRWVERK